LRKKNAWEQQGRELKVREQGVGFLERWAANCPPARGSGGAMCGLRHTPTEIKFVHFGLKIWHLVTTTLTIFVRISWPIFSIFYDRHDVTRCGPHSLENMDYGQKLCLALGIFIQYNSYLKLAYKIMHNFTLKMRENILAVGNAWAK